MKRIYTLLALACLPCLTSFGQTTGYGIYGDTLGCQNMVGFNMTIGAMPETGGILTVDWGDGNTTTHNYTTTSGNTTHFMQALHGYDLPGNYTIQYNVYSGTAGQNVNAGQTYQITALGQDNCGQIWITTSQPTPALNYDNVPYLFTDVNNNTITISPYSNWGTGSYLGLNPANAPYTVTIDPSWLASNGLAQTSPAFTITGFDQFGYATNSWETVNVTCNTPGSNPDFGVSFAWASNFVAPLQSGSLRMNICNYACSVTSNVSVAVQMPANYIPNTSGLTNPVVTGTTLTFDILALAACEFVDIPFTFPGNTPAGTPFCFHIALNHPNDSYLGNNQDTVCGWVLNSYDPNEKLVDLSTNIDPDALEELQYIVHFQNDGNFDALNVVVRDTISSNLDLSTFRYISSKHPVAISINSTTREVTFSFNNIQLGQSAVDLAASQGHVVYTISEVANLPVGSTIENTAYIYFDYNPPIVTNTTYNINELPLGLSDNKIESISLYPNPAKDKIRFSGAEVNEVIIYDLAGKVVLETATILNNEVSLNHIQTGIYQVVLKTKNSTSTQKLVIQK